jgi:hypothetical protein
MSAEYNLGLFIGILVGLAIVAVFFFVTGKKKMWVYDERQKLARAQAFKWAYITLIGGGFAAFSPDEMRECLTAVREFIPNAQLRGIE